jgi:ribonuclease-3
MFWQTDIATKIAELIGYHFKDVDLLRQALTRKSAILEHKQLEAVGHNETLATLGDGLLRAVIDDILMEIKPDYAKGELSPQRDELVNNIKLAKIAQEINLGSFLIMGKGEQKNHLGSGKNKILATSLEALIGAIFQDSKRDYLTIKKFIIKHWKLNITYRREYGALLIKAIIEKDEQAVEYSLAIGIDPNTSTDLRDSLLVQEAAFYRCPFDDFKDGVWGRNKVTLFCSDITSGTALQHAILSDRLVRPISTKPSKPSPGREAYIEDGMIYSKPLYIPSKNPSLEEVLSSLAPISLGNMNYIQNLKLAPWEPGYKVLREFFSSPISQPALQIIKLLLQHGADPNKTALFGETALHTAAYVGDLEVVKLLLEHKADPTIADKRGGLPKSCTNSEEILKLLAPQPAATTKSNENDAVRNRFFKPETLSNDEHHNAYTTTQDDNSYGCYIL